MANDAEKIFYGPGDLSLYDATNGWLFCGYLDKIEVKGKDLGHKIIDGNTRQYGISYTFKATLQQSNQGLIDSLKTRRTTRQTIYIAGLNNLVTLSSIFISYAPDRDQSGEDEHVIALSAKTSVEDNVTIAQNLLGTSGKMETFTGGVADGWTTDAGTKASGSSHLSGGGNEQRITLNNDYFRQDVNAPFEAPRRITVSAYVIDRGGTGSDLKIGFVLLDSAGAVISTHEDDFTLTASADGRQTYTAIVNPGEPVAQIRAQIRESQVVDNSIGIDNFQLQFGKLTTFADN